MHPSAYTRCLHGCALLSRLRARQDQQRKFFEFSPPRVSVLEQAILLPDLVPRPRWVHRVHRIRCHRHGPVFFTAAPHTLHMLPRLRGSDALGTTLRDSILRRIFGSSLSTYPIVQNSRDTGALRNHTDDRSQMVMIVPSDAIAAPTVSTSSSCDSHKVPTPRSPRTAVNPPSNFFLTTVHCSAVNSSSGDGKMPNQTLQLA